MFCCPKKEKNFLDLEAYFISNLITMLISISADSLLHCFPICDPHHRALHRTKIHGPPLTEGFCLMRLLGPGKVRISQKLH